MRRRIKKRALKKRLAWMVKRIRFGTAKIEDVRESFRRIRSRGIRTI